MDRSGMIDKALEMLSGDIDEIEGSGAMAHSLENCPDPATCPMHDGELGENLAEHEKQEDGSPAAVEIHIKPGLPTLEQEKAEDGLSPEEKEALAKLLK